MSKLDDGSFKELAGKIDPVSDVAGLFWRCIEPEPPILVTDGGLICCGYNEKLELYRELLKNLKQWMLELEALERKATGIYNLRIRYNKVSGYFIEVTKCNLDKGCEGRYERKQTLTNAERFITPELKEKETLILEAQESLTLLEYDLSVDIWEKVKAVIKRR